MGSHLYLKIIQLIILLSPFLHTQSIEPRFDTLPIGIPNCVLHDSHGFIWIGAQVGLFRYDGYELKFYQPEPFDSTSLSVNYVSAIKEDARGNLWIGTWGGGLNYFDQQTEKFTRFMDDPLDPDDIGSNSISQILVNRDGSLWLGTTDNGFAFLSWKDNGSPVCQHFNHKSIPRVELTNNCVTALYLDRENMLWIGSYKEGLICFDPSTKEIRYFRNDPNNPASLSDNSVSAICEDDSGYLWIGTGHPLKNGGSGLNRFDRRTETFQHHKNDPADPSSLCSNIISCLEIDQQGILWIGTEDNGINSIALKDLCSGKKLEFRRYSNFQPKIINKIYRDRLDNIWIAPLDMQVYKFDQQQSPFLYYGPVRGKPEGMKDSGIECLYIDKKGNIWFGHHFSGLDKYDPLTGRYTHFPHIPGSNRGPSSGWINGICEDSDDNFWIGTSQNGLDRYDPQTGIFSNIRSDPSSAQGLRSDNIRCLISRGNGGLWLASQYKGLQIFDTRKQIFRQVELDSTATQGIHTLYEDTHGKLWIGTLSNGIYRLTFDQEQLTAVEHFVHDPHDHTSLGNNTISDMVQPQVNDTSALWIATDNGLERLDLVTRTFTHFYERDGLPGNYVLSVLEDNSGDIWVSTTQGIGRINLRTHTFRSFGEGDGLPFLSFGGARQNTAKSADGQLFFSGADGSIGIYPDQIKDNPHIPPIRLTDFRIFHEKVKLDTAIQFKKTITLHHDQNAFSFTFAALNFTNPEKNQYAYMMEGFHEDWIPIGNERTASFTNLDPGRYVFRVKGSNNHGIWNEEGASIQVMILPPWWRSNLAYALYLLFFITVLYSGWRFQLNRLRLKHQLELEHLEATKLQEVDHLKSRFFANISHEFRTPLTLILGPLQKWLPKLRNQDLKQDLKLMQRNANRLYRLINQLLDLSKLESGSLVLQASEENIVPLLRGYVQSFESQARLKKITLDFKAEQESIMLYVDRDKIEKIIYNLLSNAFKFTPAGGRIDVVVWATRRVALTNEGVEIQITDTGRGIPPDKLDHIFDRFYQVDDSSVRDHEGSGIGLALTKELVELHHGEIQVESVLGKGTTFIVWLPLGREHLQENEIITTVITESSQKVAESVVELEIGGGRRGKTRKKLPLILLVEDNSDVRLYIRGHMESQYQILEAGNGREGIEWAIAEIPDLIISDVMMPEMDGFEFCRRIKTDQRSSHIPVILLTARAETADKVEGLETGADDYLVKPFIAEELLARVKNLIEQRCRLRERFSREVHVYPDELCRTPADSSFTHRLMEITLRRLSDSGFGLEELAEELGMSRMTLHRKIMGLSGQSPGDFVRTIRLKQGATLLKNKTFNISEVAYEVGFESPSNFSKNFRRQFGVSPSQYLKQTLRE